MYLNINNLEPKFQKSVTLVAGHLGLSVCEDGIKIETKIQGEGIQITGNDQNFNIKIAKEQYFMRALGLLVEKLKAGHRELNIKESPSNDKLGIRFDSPRSGSLNLKTYKDFLTYAALMGYMNIQGCREKDYDPKVLDYGRSLFIEESDKECTETNSGQVIISGWTNNGVEDSIFSILPDLLVWAEQCYSGNDESNYLTRRFETCTQGNYGDFLKLAIPMLSPKHILYQDILNTTLDLHIDKATYTLHFQKNSREFDYIIKNNPSRWNYIFETRKILCDILSIKSHCIINIRQGYKESDKERLRQYSSIFLPELIQKMEDFIQVYRKQWEKENKISGLDTFDMDMGGLIQRVKTAKFLIGQYVDNEICSIEEFDQVLV